MTNPDPTYDTGPAPARRRLWPLLLGVLVVGLLAGLLLPRITSDNTSVEDDPAPTRPGTSTTAAPLVRPASKDVLTSDCDLPDGDWNAAAAPPTDVEWQVPFNLAGPVLEGYGPGVTGGPEGTDGTHTCFAWNPLGAVMAAMWFLVDDENPTVTDLVVAKAHVSTLDLVSGALDRLSQASTTFPGQMVGYKIVEVPTTADDVLVELLLGSTTGDGQEALVGIQLPMSWEGDWVVDFPEGAFTRTLPTSTEGYTLWGPPEVTEGVPIQPANFESGLATSGAPLGSPAARVAPFGAVAQAPKPTLAYTALEQKWADGFTDQPEEVADLSKFAGMSHEQRNVYMTPNPPLSEADLAKLRTLRPDGCGDQVTVPCAANQNLLQAQLSSSGFLHMFFVSTAAQRADVIDAPVGSAVEDKGGCGNPLDCAVTLVAEAVDRLEGAVSGVADALSAIASFSPENLAEEWARTAAEGTVKMMDKIIEGTTNFASPAYDKGWWGKQYAVTYGLGFVVLAFMLLWIGARLGSGGMSGMTLAREAVHRLPFVVVAMPIAPAFMLETQRVFADLAEGFGKAGNAEAGSAAQTFIDAIASTADRPGDQSFIALIGGGLVALLIMGLLVILSLIVLIELAFATWGASFFGLLVPMALAASLYPPWRKMLTGLVTFLVGLWAIPFAINLVYWSTWSAAAGALKDDFFATALYVLVGTFMLAAAPVLAPIVLMRMVPDYESPSKGGASAGGSQKATSSKGGDVTTDVSQKYAAQAQKNPLDRTPRTGQPSVKPPTGGSGAGAGGGSATKTPGGTPGTGSGGGEAKTAGGLPGGSTGAGGVGGAGGATGAKVGASAGATAGGASGATTAASGAAGAAAGPAAPVVVAAVAAKTIRDKMRADAHNARSRWTR